MRNVCSVFLAIFWLAASSHPLLESAGFIHQENKHAHDAATHDDDGDNDHDAADGKCPVNFGKVSTPQPPTIQIAFVFLFYDLDLTETFQREIKPSGLAPPERAPIPISSWQFSLRAALAPRAPSFLS